MTQMAQTGTNVPVNKGNTIPCSRTRKYCITINNYTEKIYNELKLYAEKKCVVYVIGKEVGGTKGTQHLQCYLRFKNPVRFNSLKTLFPTAHIEVAKGNDQQNLTYCSKEGDCITNIKRKLSIDDWKKAKQDRIFKKKYGNVKWLRWQKQVLTLLKKQPDDRTIHWIVDEEGCFGKSFLTKYIYLTRKTLIAKGKKNDVFNELRKMEEQQIEPEVILVDVPRYNVDYVNYGMLEEFKDGLIFAGKYEGDTILIDDVHVIVFANEEPNYRYYTGDRWHVYRIIDKSLKRIGVKKKRRNIHDLLLNNKEN